MHSVLAFAPRTTAPRTTAQHAVAPLLSSPLAAPRPNRTPAFARTLALRVSLALPLALLLALALTACGGGGDDSSPIAAAPPELLGCRARADSPHSFAEISLRTATNLGFERVPELSGRELHARLHPDGKRVVFARERDPNDPTSREVIVSSIDGTTPDTRLTANGVRDDRPCWAPDGNRILFVSERDGAPGLYTMNVDGTGQQPLLLPPAGERYDAPDWCRETDRLAFVRTAGALTEVLLANGNGGGLTPLLTPLSPGLPPGTTTFADPAFSPDGALLAVTGGLPVQGGRTALLAVETATGAVRTLLDGLSPQWTPSLPRWTPAADRVFFGAAEPGIGAGAAAIGPRLASVAAAGGDPLLVWPDVRWRLNGLDFAAGLPARPPADAPRLLDVEDAELQLAAGVPLFGGRAMLHEADGNEMSVATSTFEGREVAGVNLRYTLPVLDPEAVLALHVRVVARVLRGGAQSRLRSSLYNPVDERFDTVIETLADASPRTLTYSTSSLRHVTQQRQVRFTVIGDVEPGERTELRIDQVQLRLVTRATPP